uniref:Retrotransposon gag domain-containing protein n=1 Tax=Tanacetum cinerariifolium TaxID=118510 RepID=A0A6L2K376_TANCI|nr:hypothetical protein [Tanacetum cinerariifolium]
MSKTHKLKRLYKVGLIAKVESSHAKETIPSLGEDASKQGRLSDIDADEAITLVSTHDDAKMFDADQDLHGEVVFVAKQDKTVVEKEVDNKSFDNIQELFDKAIKRVNTFVDYKNELVVESLKEGGTIGLEVILVIGHFVLLIVKVRPVDFDLLALVEAITLVEDNKRLDEVPPKSKNDMPLRDNGSDHEDSNKHIEKVLEIVDLFHIPSITIDQVMLRALPMSLTGSRSRWLRNEPTGSITTWDGLKTKFLNKYGPPARTAKKIEEINNSQQEPDENLYQAWEQFKELLMKCVQHYLTETQEPCSGTPFRPPFTNCNELVDHPIGIKGVIVEIFDEIMVVWLEVYGTRWGEERKAYSEASQSIPQKEKDPWSFTLPCFINNVCFDNALVDLGASVSITPLLTYLNLGLGELVHTKLTIELVDRTMKYPKVIAENVLVRIGKFVFPVDFIILDMPKDIKVPLILRRPFLSTARAKIDVYKRKITLRIREEKIVFTSVKPTSSLIKRVYMLSLRKRMELDLESRLTRETLVLNRSLDPFFEDYIELNDLNKPVMLMRYQGEDLMPTIEEGKVIEEFRTRNDEIYDGIDDYPSYYAYNKKIHIDCALNLKFSCMIGFECTHANLFLLLYVNVMSLKFHNSIMNDKMVYKGNNVVGALMNVPIFVRTFSVVTDFAVLENMDGYPDEGMGDVIFGKPFLRDVRIKARGSKRIITIHNGDNYVTYQMVRSHPRFKHLTNEQCNKIPPLLKVSDEDKMNGISHPYQNLKRFYQGVLNLGPDYIRDAKMEEWITRGHICVHEME